MLQLTIVQFKFYQTFLNINEQDCIAKKTWLVFKQLDNSSPKDFLDHYESLNLNIIEKNIQDRKDRIRNSEKTTLKRYLELFNLEYNNDVLYKSMLNDQDKAIITRWRLSSHPLYIETGRYKKPAIDKSGRKCMICNVLEDEEHAIYKCIVHIYIHNRPAQLLADYPNIKLPLNPKKEEDIYKIAKFLKEIEKNMETLKMIR